MILKVAMGAVLKCVSEWKMNFGEKQLPSTESNKKSLESTIIWYVGSTNKGSSKCLHIVWRERQQYMASNNRI